MAKQIIEIYSHVHVLSKPGEMVYECSMMCVSWLHGQNFYPSWQSVVRLVTQDTGVQVLFPDLLQSYTWVTSCSFSAQRQSRLLRFIPMQIVDRLFINIQQFSIYKIRTFCKFSRNCFPILYNRSHQQIYTDFQNYNLTNLDIFQFLRKFQKASSQKFKY